MRRLLVDYRVSDVDSYVNLGKDLIALEVNAERNEKIARREKLIRKWLDPRFFKDLEWEDSMNAGYVFSCKEVPKLSFNINLAAKTDCVVRVYQNIHKDPVQTFHFSTRDGVENTATIMLKLRNLDLI